MPMPGHYHAIIWIDHLEARVFHFNISDVERLVLHPHNPTRHIHHKANTIGSGHAGVDPGYFDEVAEAIGDAGAVLITGPAQTKNQLAKHIARHSPKLMGKIVGVEGLDHLTDGELVALARKHFKADHQVPPRS
jgi:stalled ribosome rescue protein Dom34